MYKRKFPSQVFLVKCSGIENSKEFAMNLAIEVGGNHDYRNQRRNHQKSLRENQKFR